MGRAPQQQSLRSRQSLPHRVIFRRNHERNGSWKFEFLLEFRSIAGMVRAAKDVFARVTDPACDADLPAPGIGINKL